MNNSTMLSVSHLIFLSKDQRYDLYNGKDIEVVGISLPVWYHKGKTSEPANEVFVKYKLLNRKTEPLVKHNKEGYEIQLPPNSKKTDDWNEGVIEGMPSLKDILDIKDGGCAWLAFKQTRKIPIKETKLLTITHFVQIKEDKELLENH